MLRSKASSGQDPTATALGATPDLKKQDHSANSASNAGTDHGPATAHLFTGQMHNHAKPELHEFQNDCTISEHMQLVLSDN